MRGSTLGIAGFGLALAACATADREASSDSFFYYCRVEQTDAGGSVSAQVELSPDGTRQSGYSVWTTPAREGSSPSQPAAQQQAERGVEDPLAFVAETYRAYRREPNGPDWPAFAYSDRLRALFDAYDAWTAQHQDLVGSLDFDWWTNAQDWELGPVMLTETRERPDRRTITARFSNAGTPVVNRFIFVRQGTRWYLDEVVNGERGEEGWMLSDLLRQREE